MRWPGKLTGAPGPSDSLRGGAFTNDEGFEGCRGLKPCHYPTSLVWLVE